MTMRWGICGTGRIAEKFVSALALVEDAEVVAVCSRTAERAEEFGAHHDIGRRYGDRQMLAEDPDVDVVYVATTQDDHHDAVLVMLGAGRHVLCEKPLALSEMQAAAMTETAARNECFLMEAMWSRFSPLHARMCELLDAGRIGTPLEVRADLSLSVPPEERSTHRLWDLERGGGALLDVGIYPLQLSSFVLGVPSEVRAVGVLADSGVDRRVGVLLGHPDDALAVLSAGIDLQGDRDARITGTDGSIVIEAPMHASRVLRVEVGGESERIECGPPGLHLQVPEVHRCISEGLLQSPVMSWEESLSILGTTDRIRAEIGLRYPGE